MTLFVTAYCSCVLCCGKHAVGLTASGVPPQPGRTCAAPRSVPFGTWLFVPTVGWRRVEDRLAHQYDNRIDIFMLRHSDAVKFGKRRLTITQHTK